MGEPVGNGCWSEAIEGRRPPRVPPGRQITVGVLPGEGIGPEVVRAAVGALQAATVERGLELLLTEPGDGSHGGSGETGLKESVARFCEETFAGGGALLAGAHGGRWVYDLRRRFDLFCKISPLRPPAGIASGQGGFSPDRLADIDLLVVREQTAGVYQGRWSESVSRDEGRVAEHSFSYTEREVRRLIEVAARLARSRRGRLAVVVKDAGIPSISSLWRDCALEIAADELVLEVLEVDYAVYRMLRHPLTLDVLVAPNLFGDLLSDAGGALLGSRGITFGGNFDSARAAVYQTNHGAAHDLAGSDRANPGGQILSAAMLLRESFGLGEEAERIETALATAWRDGWRTPDVAEPGCRVIGTVEMGERVAERVVQLAGEGEIGTRAAGR
jgi:3-isopropylmalate dehydrogenase